MELRNDTVTFTCPICGTQAKVDLTELDPGTNGRVVCNGCHEEFMVNVAYDVERKGKYLRGYPLGKAKTVRDLHKSKH